MANPKAVSDSSGEWVEIYNITSSEVMLSGWKLQLGNTNHYLPDDLVIKPGTYFVLCRNQDKTKNGFIDCDYEIPSLSLTNTEGTLCLVDQKENSFTISYSKDWVKEGKSTELQDHSFCLDYRENPESWLLPQCWGQSSFLLESGDYGTPGNENSSDKEIVSNFNNDPNTETDGEEIVGQAKSGNNDDIDYPELFLTELMPDPVGQDTKFNEFIEIYNPNSFEVDLKSWSLLNQKGQSYTFNESILLSSSGYFLVLKKDFDFALHNNEEEITLLNPAGQPTDNLYFLEKAKMGESLNKTDENIYWSPLISPGFENYPKTSKTEPEESAEKEKVSSQANPKDSGKNIQKTTNKTVSLTDSLGSPKAKLLKTTPLAPGQINIWGDTLKPGLMNRKNHKREILKFLSTML